MNLVHSFVRQNWSRWYPTEPTPEFSTLLLTPQFRASAHVLFLLVPHGSSTPRLVAKLPRLSADQQSLRSEAENLLSLEGRFGRSESVPHLLAYEDYAGTRVLLESAVAGAPLSPGVVRQCPERAIELVSRWLLDLHQKTAIEPAADQGWFERLYERPIALLQKKFLSSGSEQMLLQGVAGHCEALHDSALPVVFAHGDLSAPNLFHRAQSAVGVVDWETAEPYGPPVTDLFFFFTFVAMAKAGARTLRERMNAFESAFFVPRAWARPYVADYAQRAGIPMEWLTPLFVLGWTRYLASLVVRLDGKHTILQPETLQWLHNDHYYSFWQYSIAKAEAIDWNN